MRLGEADVEVMTRDEVVIVEVTKFSHIMCFDYAARLDGPGNNTQYHTRVNMIAKPSWHVRPFLVMQMYPPDHN